MVRNCHFLRKINFLFPQAVLRENHVLFPAWDDGAHLPGQHCGGWGKRFTSGLYRKIPNQTAKGEKLGPFLPPLRKDTPGFAQWRFRIPEGKMAKPEEKPERDKTHCSTSTVEAKLPNQCTQKSPAPPEARASLCAKLQPFPGSGLLTEPLCCYGVRMIDTCQPFVFLHSLG